MFIPRVAYPETKPRCKLLWLITQPLEYRKACPLEYRKTRLVKSSPPSTGTTDTEDETSLQQSSSMAFILK
jgi:hypothetical protein